MDDTEDSLTGSDSVIKCLILSSIKEFALVFSKGENQIEEKGVCWKDTIDNNQSSNDFEEEIHFGSDPGDNVDTNDTIGYLQFVSKNNVRDEILNFLGNSTSNEFVVFYCMTNGLPLELYLDEVISSNELTPRISAIFHETYS